VLTRRQFIQGCLGATTLGAGLLAYAAEIEPFWVEEVHRPLSVRGLPATLRGRRLVHLSDLHVGGRVPDDYVLREFGRVAELRPDILVVTGDLTQASGGDQAERVLARMPHGALGTFCVLGNHDYGHEWQEAEKADLLSARLRASGVTVLRNEVAEVAGVQIVGMDDLWAHRFRPDLAFGAADPSAPTICLTHNPDTVNLEGWGAFEGWILAGHTHGGQCKPPLLPPPRSVVRDKRYIAGEYELPRGRRMYINRGLGFVNQLRFNARPEITVFELASA